MKEEGHSTGIGDEGGFAPKVSSNEEPLDLILKAIEQAGYKPGKDIGIAIDLASSAFYKEGRYVLKTEDRQLIASEMVEKYQSQVMTFL